MAKRTGNRRRRDGIATAPDRRTTPPSDSFSSRTSLSMTHAAVFCQDLSTFGAVRGPYPLRITIVRGAGGAGLPWNARKGSEMPGERCPIRRALLQERIAAFGGLVGHVGQAGGLTGEELLTHKAVVDQVEREFQHALRGRALAVHQRRPFERGRLEVAMVHD